MFYILLFINNAFGFIPNWNAISILVLPENIRLVPLANSIITGRSIGWFVSNALYKDCIVSSFLYFGYERYDLIKSNNSSRDVVPLL